MTATMDGALVDQPVELRRGFRSDAPRFRHRMLPMVRSVGGGLGLFGSSALCEAGVTRSSCLLATKGASHVYPTGRPNPVMRIRHGALTAFPLFGSPPRGAVDYLLSDEAISAGSVTVEEVSEEGAPVPNLLVTNQGDSRVLFLEGEELRGAKQNRVLNTSVLVAAHSKTPIPVSCVEQGRLAHIAPDSLNRADTHSSSKLRHYLKASVSHSLKSGRGHSSDQGAVWHEVSRQMDSLGSSSETAAMSDTYLPLSCTAGGVPGKRRIRRGAIGIAVAVG